MLVIHAASSPVTLRLFVESVKRPHIDKDIRFVYLSGEGHISQQFRDGEIRVRLPRGYLFFLAWLSSRQSLKKIMAKEPDVLHVHTPATALGLVWVLRGLAKRKVRLVYTARGGFDEGRNWMIRAMWNLIDPLRWTLWDSVGVVNASLEAKAKKYRQAREVTLLGLGAASPNLSDFELVRSNRRGALDGSVIRLAWVGRFSRDKRPSDFLRLLTILNETHGVSVRGVMMGDGDPIDRARVNTRDRDDVERMGWVGCPQEILVDCDLLVSTSVREGYGLVPVEAAMVGTPTIAYKTSGTSKSVFECGGRLVPSGDLDALAKAVLQWMELSPSSREALRARVQRLAQNLVSGLDLMAEMKALYGPKA